MVPDDTAVDGIADAFVYKSEFSVVVDELVFTSSNNAFAALRFGIVNELLDKFFGVTVFAVLISIITLPGSNRFRGG